MEIVTGKPDSVRAGLVRWQAELRESIRDPLELCRRLGLPESLGRDGAEGEGEFATFCPIPFFNRIQPGNARDPLLLQVLPQKVENEQHADEKDDPLEEKSFSLTPGVIQKYTGRVLLIATSVCAIHCRYCFRRFYPYSEAPKSVAQWEPALELISNDRAISEVILSGGDPLMLVDHILSQLLQRLDSIEHVNRIRIHTRLPIMIPSRITETLVNAIDSLTSKLVMVIHSNHANEIDAEVRRALGCLQESNNVLLLNQSVMLKGINDNVEALVELSQRLVDVGVTPYYIHELDPVSGTRHFRVERERAKMVIEQMRGCVSGYLVPRLVVEEPGGDSKRVLM